MDSQPRGPWAVQSTIKNQQSTIPILCGQCSRERALQLQQLPLHVEAAAVATEGSVRCNYAVAGDYDRHWIAIICHADGAKTSRPSHCTRDVGIAARFAVGDRQQRSPASPLKSGTAQIESEAELPALAREIFVELLHISLHRGCGFLEAKCADLPEIALVPQIARVGTNHGLAGCPRIEFQRNQSAAGSGQEQRAYR